MAELTVVNDINGDYYVAGSSGEIEEDLAYRHVVVLAADAPYVRLGRVLDGSDADTLAFLNRTVKLNYWYLLSVTDRNSVPLTVARKIAYLRVFALTRGLGDGTNDHGSRNLSYNDIRFVQSTVSYTPTGETVAVNDPSERQIPNFADDVDWRSIVRTKFANIVSIVAYFFRIRGHHWIEDMDDRYKSVWRRCLYEEDTPGLDWKFIAHHVLHFVYPDVLDEFWKDCVDNARCAGTLVKRFTSLPAGVAAVGAVTAGAYDLQVVFPNFRSVMPEAFAELDRCNKAIGGRSWVGSVNRRFYNAGNLVVNEPILGSLASVILTALANTANAAPLANSNALRRVADNAPITGNLLVAVMAKATQDDRMVDALFVEAEDVD